MMGIPVEKLKSLEAITIECSKNTQRRNGELRKQVESEIPHRIKQQQVNTQTAKRACQKQRAGNKGEEYDYMGEFPFDDMTQVSVDGDPVDEFRKSRRPIQKAKENEYRRQEGVDQHSMLLEVIKAEYEQKLTKARRSEESVVRVLENWKQMYGKKEVEAMVRQIENAELAGQLENQKKKIHALLEQHTEDQQHRKYLETRIYQLEAKVRSVESDLGQKNSSLAKMQEKIVELTSRGIFLELRDDNYFGDRFEKLRTSVNQWANRYFRTNDTISLETLSKPLQQILLKVARDPSWVFANPKATRARAQIVSGTIGYTLMNHTKQESLLLGAPKLMNKMLRDLKDCLGGSAKDIQRWCSLTTTLALKSPQFEAQQFAVLRAFTEETRKLLEPLADKSLPSSEMRHGLLRIFTESAHIFQEIAQQETTIFLQAASPYTKEGKPVIFDPCYMDDIEGLEEDEELVARNAAINIIEFPGLSKGGFDYHGNVAGTPFPISKIKVSCK